MRYKNLIAMRKEFLKKHKNEITIQMITLFE